MACKYCGAPTKKSPIFGDVGVCSDCVDNIRITGEPPAYRGPTDIPTLVSLSKCKDLELADLRAALAEKDARIGELEAENKRLREALESIADGNDHFHGNPAKWPQNIARAAIKDGKHE